MVVYLDSLIVLNILLDYLLLLLAGRMAGAVLCRWRLGLAALCGGLYAGALFWPGWPFLAHPVTRLGTGVLLVLIGYGRERRLLRLVVLFFALSAALAGALYALSFLGMGVGPVRGVAAPVLELRYILLFAALGYCALSLAGRGLARHGPREQRPLEICLDGRRVRLTALVDTGNTLTDPMTGQGVIVAEGRQLAPLLPPEADFTHPCQCFPALRDPKRFRLLPYRAVGVDRGLLLAVRADGVTLSGRELGPRLVALSPTPVSDGGSCSALIFEE